MTAERTTKSATSGGRPATLGNRVAPPRFILFACVTAVAAGLAATRIGLTHGSLVGFDIGAAVFLLSHLALLKSSGPDQMRRHALENDANRIVLLAIAVAVMVIVVTAVAAELGHKNSPAASTIVLIVGTLAMAWSFTTWIYGLHYAHMYYSFNTETRHDCGGLQFPETPEPIYWDFLYFAACLGMTFQTSDTDITSVRFRRVVMVHSMSAFVFSICVIAFSINVLGSSR